MTAGHLEDRIIPIAIDDTELQDVNEYLTTMQAIELSTSDDVTNALSKRFGELREE